MPIRQQKLHSIEITSLKGLKNVAIGFEPHNVTGIFGANGSGKSSLIHALLSIFKPSDEDLNRIDFKFSRFFRPTSHTNWRGSAFKISHSYRQDAIQNSNITREYSKQHQRWAPRYTNRPERNVYFVGLSTSVPDIELEKRDNMVTLATARRNDRVSNDILRAAGTILNRNYLEYNEHDSGGKKYIGLRLNNIRYSSLSMGAGEQRIFRILETVFRAPKYSLIVIDELDATLHTDALNKLITVLVDKARANNLQIVFTSHREVLTNRTDINLRHLYQTTARTLCFNETNPDCLARLTGTRQRPIEIFVEDDLAECITRKVAEDLNLVRYCSIKKYGSAGNAFSLVTGMMIKGEDLSNTAIFLDGDEYRTEAQRLDQMEKYFSGTETNAVARRRTAVDHIRAFSLPVDMSPEQLIHTSLQMLNDGSEVCNTALDINGVSDRHEYVNNIITGLGYGKEQGLNKVIDKFSTTSNWSGYSQPLREWLEAQRILLTLP